MDFEDVKKSLWHAFYVLDNAGDVKKSRVRVLTNNLGHKLGVDQAETIWDKVNEEVIDFDFFVATLRANLLVGIEKNTDPHVATLRAELDNLCWMLCEKAYLSRIIKKDGDDNNSSDGSERKTMREFSKADLFKLWKVFNFLCERSGDGCMVSPLRIDVEEADRISCEICTTLGLPAPKTRSLSSLSLSSDRGGGGAESRSSSDLWEEPDGQPESFQMDFCQFVKYVADSLGTEESEEVISHGILEVHGQIISDVVRKGHLIKFGNKVTAWKERWFVLTASALRYFLSSDERECKGSIVLCSECFTQSFPDKPGGKHHRFKLHTPNKQYELSAPDLKTKNMWMSDIKRVVSHIGFRKESLQQVAWKERKAEREERRRRTAEDKYRRCAERETLEERERQLEELRVSREKVEAEMEARQRQLEKEKQDRKEEEERRKKELDELMASKREEIDAERQKCLETETRLKAEREELLKMNQAALEAERMEREDVMQRLREEEAKLEEEKEALKRKLKELEEAKDLLEKAVEEERALKRDEEIVRNLQAKILEEEFAKREELERLRDEQRKQLVEEQLSRQELEEAHRKQEEELRQKQGQLETLIADREEADLKWKDASDRLKQAETDRVHLEERLKLKEMSSSVSLAKPLLAPNPNPFVTHRGLGAFSDADFVPGHGRPSPSGCSESNSNDSCKKERLHSTDSNGSNKEQLHTDSSDINKGEQLHTDSSDSNKGEQLHSESNNNSSSEEPPRQAMEDHNELCQMTETAMIINGNGLSSHEPQSLAVNGNELS